MKNFVIINRDQVLFIDFNQVLETNINTLRYNLDKSKTFITYIESKPSFITSEIVYDESEFKELIGDYNNGWCVDPEIEEII